MALNLLTVGIFSLNLWLNAGQWTAVQPNMTLAIILPLIGLIATTFAGYLGYTLVQTHHVGVDLPKAVEKFEEQRKKRAA